MKSIILFILQILFNIVSFLFANMVVERYSGIDIIFNKELKIKSADVYVEKNIYFLVVSENGRSSLKALNYSQNGVNKLVDVLNFPVRSAQSVAVDWVNGNIYWADKGNRFFEVVDINHGLVFPLMRQRRHILFSQKMFDIDSMVVDPWEQYIFWLHIGPEIIIERAKLNGQDRMIIFRSIQHKSSCLTIDRHTKMLFWLGNDATIHRIDYQGGTGCSMHLNGDWKDWHPTFFVFSESRLLFINKNTLWTMEFKCGSGDASSVETTRSPAAVVAVGYQLARPGMARGQCSKASCNSICLPSMDSRYQCVCSTGIKHLANGTCPLLSSRSLFIGSPPRIYQLSLETPQVHMDPIFEETGIPFRLAYDSFSSSIFYVEYNTNSIHIFPLNGNKVSTTLVLDSPVLFQAPSTFAIDSPSRNIYWMNYQTTEVWVARVSSSYHLKNNALLLSWKTATLSGNRIDAPLRDRQALLPGELAVDSNHRYLFVSAIRDGVASIERYWLDGSNKFVVLKSSDITSPRGLALDTVKQELFFIDTSIDEMICVGYNGTNFRVIAKKFPDFFGLTFLDGYIYWTDVDSLTVNQIRSDGQFRSTIVSTYNLRAAEMPIVAMTTEINLSTNSPCNANVCDQLCFPTRSSSQSYSCGCSNPAHMLINMPRCTRQGRVALMYNFSYIELQHIVVAADTKIESVFKMYNEYQMTSIQIDRFRDVIYWVDVTNNCIEKAMINSHTRRKSTIFCLTSDKIVSISIDANRNNLYVSIRSHVWSRIEIIRLPFHNDEVMWRRVIASGTKDTPFMGCIMVHSSTKRIFWLASKSEDKYGIVALHQAGLAGDRHVVLWRGVADIDELVIDDNGLHLYWKHSKSGRIYEYDMTNRTVQVFAISVHLLKNAIFHIDSSDRVLYLSLNSSIYVLSAFSSQKPITWSNLKLFLNVSIPNLMNGFSILPQNLSTKVALLKSDLNSEPIIMCPDEATDSFSVCSHICLPSAVARCSCGSPYSLKKDGYSCVETKNHLLVLTSSGEVIGLEMTARQDRANELDAVEWIEIPEHRVLEGQRFIDAIYWNSKKIILLLDNEGQLIGKHRSWSYQKTKTYKRLSILREENDILKTSSTYEKAYRHFLDKDVSYRDQYESSRYSIALDPISETLIWSDWVNGVIVTENLNNNQDTIDYVGIVVDFRHSSRRPLKIAVAPISSSLVWISADLASTGANDSSIWRHFWIELSDMDGSRRTVLIKDPGVPFCLTVDVHTGGVYWIDKRKNVLMYLHIYWDSYQIKAGHILARRLKVTVSSIFTTGVGHSSLAMTVLKRHLIWADWFQQILLSASLDNGDANLHSARQSTEKIQVFELKYLKEKLKNVVKLLARLGSDELKTSSVESLIRNHTCSHERSDGNRQLCSHLCLSTIPISLAEEYSILMTVKQLGGKFRCACPYDMAVKYGHKSGTCVKTTFIQCEKFEFLCRAGRIFKGSEKVVSDNCLSHQSQCNMVEDCLDGSDESGCSHCNTSHPYSCSGSGKCIDIKMRCNGVADCDSDEKCCDSQTFECLTGNSLGRCRHISERCDGIRNCIDGSDELGCQRLKSPDNDDLMTKNIRDNHLVAIITGCVALLACTVAILYIWFSKRSRSKTVHESCMFRANNVNIMLMSNSERMPRRSRTHHADGSMFHTKSCDLIDISKSYHDSDQLAHSLTSLSDIYQRIRDPHPELFSALKMPLFTIRDNVLFNFNGFRRVHDPYTSSDSNEKLENPPPSEVTLNSRESMDLIAANQDIVARSSNIATPCESEIDEIYFHRYRSYGHREPRNQNYPSRLLQMLLTSNHSNYLQDKNATFSHTRRLSQPNDSHHQRKKLFKKQRRRKNWKTNHSISPRRRLYCSHESLATQNISPPPPSPITVLST